jgi:2'-5' RNA ligase
MLDLAIVTLFSRDLNQRIEPLRQTISEKFQSSEGLHWPPHMTLRSGFVVPESDVRKLISSFRIFLQAVEPITVKLEGFKFIDDYKTNQWITSPYIAGINVVYDSRLKKFHERLMEFKDFSSSSGEYNPHITLAYNDITKDTFPKIKRYLEGFRFSYKLNINEVALILNEGKNHSIYRKIKLK